MVFVLILSLTILGLVFWWRGKPTFVFGSTHVTRSWNCGWSMCSCIDSSCYLTPMPWNQGGMAFQIKYVHKQQFSFCFVFHLPILYNINVSEFNGTIYCDNSKCWCHASHHFSWWISRFQVWMGWIWTLQRVMGVFVFASFSSLSILQTSCDITEICLLFQVFSLWNEWDVCWVCNSFLFIHWFWFRDQHSWGGKNWLGKLTFKACVVCIGRT